MVNQFLGLDQNDDQIEVQDQDVVSAKGAEIKSSFVMSNTHNMDTHSVYSQALPYGNSLNCLDNAFTITSQGVYFQCNGDDSCSRIICDLCQ